MKSTEIKTNVHNLINGFSKEEFIYDLLIVNGIPGKPPPVPTSNTLELGLNCIIFAIAKECKT